MVMKHTRKISLLLAFALLLSLITAGGTVSAQGFVTANPENNHVNASSLNVALGSSITLTATGDRQDVVSGVNNDSKYVPLSWNSDDQQTGSFVQNGENNSYTSTYTPASAGQHKVTVTFQSQTWWLGEWDPDGEFDTTLDITITVTAGQPSSPTLADSNNNDFDIDLLSVTTGSSVTLTATGDRQSANGAVVGDEKYLPDRWYTGEGDLDYLRGWFTQDEESGFYTSTFKPEAAGVYTINFIFVKHVWDGANWIKYAEQGDLKTAQVPVIVTGPSLPTTADPKNNKIYSSHFNIIAGYSIQLSATGDRQSAAGSVIGDERYVPTSWKTSETNETNDLTPNGIYYSTYYTPLTAGTFTVTVTYTKQTWTADGWADSGEDTKMITITVRAPAAQANANNNKVIASPGSVKLGGSVTLTATGDRQALEDPVGDDERYIPISWESTEPGKYGVFMLDADSHSYKSVYTPSKDGTYTVTATFQKQKYDAEGWEDINQDTKTTVVTVTRSSGSSGGGGTTAPPTTTPDTGNNGVIVLVNGKSENAGIATTSKRNGQNVLTIHVDQQTIENKLATEGQGAIVTIPVRSSSDVVIGELNGQMIQNMEKKQAVLEIRTDTATYTIPTQQINIGAISDQIGNSIDFQDIMVQIEIAATTADMVQVVENAASQGTFSLVVPALDFTVRATYGNTVIDISKFNVYVERTILIPDGIDPSKITTGVVVEPDGSVRHVPTKVVQSEGKYYAIINSLTNSTYSVVWHPVEYNDVAKHWAKNAVNNMGSRMVIEGTGNGMFSPDQDITRAEFAAIIVRGLGLKPENGAVPFSDVKATDWYASAVRTAFAYGLIDGFEDGTFRPMDEITREQAMTIVSKAMEITRLKDKLAIRAADTTLYPFGDAAEVSAWAQVGVADSVQAGVVSGRSAATLAPTAYMTRAEVATIIQRLLQKSGLI